MASLSNVEYFPDTFYETPRPSYLSVDRIDYQGAATPPPKGGSNFNPGLN